MPVESDVESSSAVRRVTSPSLPTTDCQEATSLGMAVGASFTTQETPYVQTTTDAARNGVRKNQNLTSVDISLAGLLFDDVFMPRIILKVGSGNRDGRRNFSGEKYRRMLD